MTFIQTKDDVSFMERKGDFIIQGSDNDTEYNKGLKERSQSFLLVNGFELDKEPLVKDMTEENFTKYISKHDFNDKSLFDKMSKVNVNINFRSMMSNVYKHKITPNLKIFVLFLPSDKGKTATIGKEIIRKFITLIVSLDCIEGLLISHKSLSPCAKEQISNCNINPENCDNIFRLTSYTDKDFVDLTQHSFFQKVMNIFKNGEETRKLAENEGMEVKDLSKLLRLHQDDAMVKFYRADVGDVFMIERRNINEKNIIYKQIVFRIVTRIHYKKR
jgi:DNA-directed RNA polymerase subunit H (RpoH/RPB5)